MVKAYTPFIENDFQDIQALLAEENFSEVYRRYAPVPENMLFVQSEAEWLDYMERQGPELEERPLRLHLAAQADRCLEIGRYEGDVTEQLEPWGCKLKVFFDGMYCAGIYFVFLEAPRAWKAKEENDGKPVFLDVHAGDGAADPRLYDRPRQEFYEESAGGDQRRLRLPHHPLHAEPGDLGLCPGIQRLVLVQGGPARSGGFPAVDAAAVWQRRGHGGECRPDFDGIANGPVPGGDPRHGEGPETGI